MHGINIKRALQVLISVLKMFADTILWYWQYFWIVFLVNSVFWRVFLPNSRHNAPWCFILLVLLNLWWLSDGGWAWGRCGISCVDAMIWSVIIDFLLFKMNSHISRFSHNVAQYFDTNDLSVVTFCANFLRIP